MTYWFLLLAFLIASVYALFFFYATIEWLKTREFTVLEKFNVVKFSIIIPFKDELNNLEICIKSILAQNYPEDSFEILLADDHSSDGSELVALDYASKYSNIKYVINSGQGKKSAISTAIVQSSHHHLITTDADTSRNNKWLASFATMFNYKGVRVVAGGVMMIPRKNSAFHYFQSMDYSGMMALSMVAMRKGWFRNGSGGNLGFTKDVYFNYVLAQGDQNVVSGDDVFLLQSAFKEGQNTVIFPKSRDIISFTHTEQDWKDFIQQRSRWAGKSFKYTELAMTFIWALVWCSSILIPVLFGLSIAFGGIYIQLFAFNLMTKLLADLVFLKSSTNYFDKSFFRYFFIAEFYHVSYVILVGINAILGRKFEWKGTKYKR